MMSERIVLRFQPLIAADFYQRFAADAIMVQFGGPQPQA
jgi:hypothetical protein